MISHALSVHDLDREPGELVGGDVLGGAGGLAGDELELVAGPDIDHAGKADRDDFVVIARCSVDKPPITDAPLYFIPARWLADQIEERHRAYLRQRPNIDPSTPARTFFWRGKKNCPRHGLAELLAPYLEAWHLIDAPMAAPA